MSRRRPGKKGVALLLVIWVLAALAVILSEVIFRGRVGLAVVRRQREDAAGYALARGAAAVALAELARPHRYLLPAEDGGTVFVRVAGDPPAERVDPRAEGSLPGKGKYFYRIVDEERKMNINRADRQQLARFFGGLGMAPGVEVDTIIDSILDWRDADTLHRLNGAEDDYYQSLTPPYVAGNGDFGTVAEVRLVKGLTAELWDGGEATGEESGRLPLFELLTVVGDRLNRNTAPAAVLAARLTPTEAEKTLREREVRPYTDERGQSTFFTVTAGGISPGAVRPRSLRILVRRDGAANAVGKLTVLQWMDDVEAPLPPKTGESS